MKYHDVVVELNSRNEKESPDCCCTDESMMTEDVVHAYTSMARILQVRRGREREKLLFTTRKINDAIWEEWRGITYNQGCTCMHHKHTNTLTIYTAHRACKLAIGGHIARCMVYCKSAHIISTNVYRAAAEWGEHWM